ncbi:MAG: hypothetical protein ACI9NY_001133 [Kiritimatiellia bacterium]|jgi:uncharacterized protein YqiB (DUF1249 family)
MSVSSVSVKKRYKVNLSAQLMTCEVNYQRLLRLLHNVQSLELQHSRQYIVGNNSAAESVIVMRVLEQTKYTSLVHIVQYCRLQKLDACLKKGLGGSGSETKASLSAPSPQRRQGEYVIYQGDVRLYHDASLAEVVKCQGYQQFAPRYEYPNINMHQIDEKAQMNRFLGELLAHCVSHGRIAEAVLASAHP